MPVPSYLQEYSNSRSEKRTYSTGSSIQKKTKTFCKNQITRNIIFSNCAKERGKCSKEIRNKDSIN